MCRAIIYENVSTSQVRISHLYFNHSKRNNYFSCILRSCFRTHQICCEQIQFDSELIKSIILAIHNRNDIVIHSAYCKINCTYYYCPQCEIQNTELITFTGFI